MAANRIQVYGQAKGQSPVRLVVCFRTLAALEELDDLLAALRERDDVPPPTTMLRTTDPRDIVQFLDRPQYRDAGQPGMRYDCVFLLDATLETPGSGVVLADHVRERSVDVPILFLTDHLEYVLIAFRAQPFDFLPRPVTQERFAEALRGLSQLQKARRDEWEQRRAAQAEASATPPPARRPAGTAPRRRKGDSPAHDRTLQWVDTTTPISLRCKGTTYRLAAGEILFIERNKTRTTIHLASKRIDCSLPLSWFVERLAQTTLFVRCHKSFLVNRRHVLLIDIKSRFVSLSYGHRCEIGRTFRKAMAGFTDPHVVRSAHPLAVLPTKGKGGGV